MPQLQAPSTKAQAPSSDPKTKESLQELSMLAPAGMRDDFLKAVKDSRQLVTNIKPREMDEVLKGAEKATASLDTNRDGRLSSREIHTEVVKMVREMLAETPLNKGTTTDPNFSFAAKTMLNHLERQQGFLVPVLKEQRIFNNLLGSYKEVLKAYDTVFPNGFSRQDAVKALDGLDGSKKDGRISGPELQAGIDAHPNEAEATVKHLTNALVRATKGAEGICEYLLARPNLVAEMAGVDMDIEQRLVSGKEMAQSYRALLKADTAEEALSAAHKLKESANVTLSE
jgi:hypothetical protein